MADSNNLVESNNLTITCTYPIANAHNTWSERIKIKTEKPDISAEDALQQHSSGHVRTELAFSESHVINTEKSELRENENRTEHSCLADIVESSALMQNHGTFIHQLNQIEESGPAKTAAEDKRFICDFCSKRFHRFCDLTKHRRYHTGEKPFVCSICDKRFSCSSNLAKHKRTHRDEPSALMKNNATQIHQLNQTVEPGPAKTAATDKRIVCDFCGKNFTHFCHLTKHRRCHTGEKPFVCNICDKRFSDLSNLSKHRRTHTGEKPFVCNVCEKRFSQAFILLRHKRCHTGEKPFVCDICGRGFSRMCNLKDHKRSHDGEKPFMCDLCEKRFSRASGLIRHKRTHTGEKPFPCDLCEKQFAQSCHLRIHQRSHTRGKKTLSPSGAISASQNPVISFFTSENPLV